MNTESSNNVIVRFPPSPTGYLHVGNLRTLVFNYLFAKKYDGKIILRVEDTDLERSKAEYEDYMIKSLKWLGLDYDEHHRQSERKSIYRSYLEKLIAEGKAYESKEQPTAEQVARAKEKGKELHASVIRFKNPNKVVTFTDEVLGEISVDTTDLGDFVIAKNLDHALYHLTVVIDDHEMNITHVIRGADHVANTPRQILLQEAIGAHRPKYGHLPLIVGSDGKKLGKRHGATATLDYREMGYLPEAFLNFISFIGWNPGDEREVMQRHELIDAFDLSKVQKGSAVFNQEKLDWLNREHLRGLEVETLLEVIDPFIQNLKQVNGFNLKMLTQILPLITERIHKLSELSEMVDDGEFSYFFTSPSVNVDDLVWKKETIDQAAKHIQRVVQLLGNAEESSFTSPDDVKEILWTYAEEVGKGSVLWPTRYALSGKKKSPDPFTLISLLGKEESVRRLEAAITKIQA